MVNNIVFWTLAQIKKYISMHIVVLIIRFSKICTIMWQPCKVHTILNLCQIRPLYKRYIYIIRHNKEKGIYTVVESIAVV